MKQNKIPRNEYIIQPKGKTNPYKHDVIYSDLGQWKYPGQVTRIPSNQITMQGVPYPVQGIDDTGYSQMMYPGMNYQFPGNYVTEYPMARYGGGLPKAQDGLSATPTYYGGKEQNKSQYPMTTTQKLIHKAKKSSEADRQYNFGKALTNMTSFVPGPIGYGANMASGAIDIGEENEVPGAMQFIPNRVSRAVSGFNNLMTSKDLYDYDTTPEKTYPSYLPYYTDEYKRELFKPQSLTSQAYGGDPSLNNIEGHYQKGGAQTPEEWEKEIRTVEHKIGHPSQWTLEGYKELQNKLNEYKAWRENTPKGKAVIDYHNEPNEYVIPLPSHLQIVPEKPFGGQNTKTHTHMANGGWLDNEYRRGGQKRKKYTSKNIQSSVNDIFTRNETLFGPAGKKRYKPGLKYKSGGGWLDNLT